MSRNLESRDFLDEFNSKIESIFEPGDTLALGFFVDSILRDTNSDYITREVLKYARVLLMTTTGHFDLKSWKETVPDWRGIYSVFNTTKEAKESIARAAIYAHRMALEMEAKLYGPGGAYFASPGGAMHSGRGMPPATGSGAASGLAPVTSSRSSLTSLKCLDGVVWYSGEKAGFQSRLDTCQHFLRILSPDRLRKCIGKDFNYSLDKFMKAILSAADQLRQSVRAIGPTFAGVSRLGDLKTLRVYENKIKLDLFVTFQLDWREVSSLSFLNFLPVTTGHFNPSLLIGSTSTGEARYAQRATVLRGSSFSYLWGGGGYTLQLLNLLWMFSARMIWSPSRIRTFFMLSI